MTKAEQRRIALGAVRSQLRHMGCSIDPFVPFRDVLRVLDDLHRVEPDLIASQWYAQASDNQIALLRREWKQAVKLVYERTLWQCLPKDNEFSEGEQMEKKEQYLEHHNYILHMYCASHPPLQANS